MTSILAVAHLVSGDDMIDDIPKLLPPLIAPYPEPEDADHAATVARIGVSLVPYFNVAISELLLPLLGPPVERRRNEWVQDLAAVVEATHKTVEELSSDEVFVSSVIRTSRMAITTHREEKRKLLRSALIKIGQGTAPNEDIVEGYFQIIEELTPSHFTVLHFLWTGVERVTKANQGTIPYGTTYGSAIENYAPEIVIDYGFINQICEDLVSKRLIKGGSLEDSFMNVSFPQPCMTNRGISFLCFVLNPDQLPEGRRT
jgi:hypothetical protein